LQSRTLNADEEGPDTALATFHILCGHGVPGELQTFSTKYLWHPRLQHQKPVGSTNLYYQFRKKYWL